MPRTAGVLDTIVYDDRLVSCTHKTYCHRTAGDLYANETRSAESMAM